MISDTHKNYPRNMCLIFLPRLRQYAPLILILLATILATAAYLQALHYPFISDDKFYVSENPKLSGLQLYELFKLFKEPYNSSAEFLPLRELSYWLDIKLFGLSPAAFRLHNLVLYLLCLPLVYSTTLMLWRYFRSSEAASGVWVAAVVTALFALHPSHAEAVVWIAGRKDVMSGLLSLFAIWLALHAKRERGLSTGYAIATLFALLAAMLSKATAVTVAPIIAMLWMIFWYDSPKSNRRSSSLFWSLTILTLAMCIAVIFATVTTQRMPFYFGIESFNRTFSILGWLTRLSVSPETRHFFYPVLEDAHLYFMVGLGVAVLVLALTGVAALLRKRTLASFAVVAFLFICLPSIQLIPYVPPSLVSDRFVFLAAWPIIFLVAALIWRLHPLPRMVILSVIALSWGFQTIQRPLDWRNFDTLIAHDMQSYPGYYPLVYQKATRELLAQGRYREAIEISEKINDPLARGMMVNLVESAQAMRIAAVTHNPKDAITHFQKLEVLLVEPPNSYKWNPPTRHFWKNIRGSFALEWQYLITSFPQDMVIRYQAGRSFFNIKNYDDAITHLRVATSKSSQLPNNLRGEALSLLGEGLLKVDHLPEAEIALRSALQQYPPALEANCTLSKIYKQTNKIKESEQSDTACINSASSKSSVD